METTYQILPSVTLDGLTFGVVNADDGDERLINLEFRGPMKHNPEMVERLGREMITVVMRALTGNEAWAWPPDGEWKMGQLD